MSARRLSLLAAALASPALAADPPSYEDDILPVFRDHCNGCHNPDKLKADLDLTSYATTIKGGSSGPAVKPGSPDSSLLYRVSAHLEEPEMPPKKPKLPDATLDLLKNWIASGAPESKGAPAAKPRDAALAMAAAPTPASPSGPPPLPESLLPPPDAAVLSAPAPVLALAASPRAPIVAVSAPSGIAIYNTSTLSLSGFLPFPERQPNVLRFSRDGSLLLAAGGRAAHSGTAVLFNIRNGSRVATIDSNSSDAILAADLSPDLSLIVCGGSDKSVRIFSSANGQLRHTIRKHTDWVTAAAFSPDGSKLATGDRNGGLHLWDPLTGTILFTLAEHQARITSLSWRPDSLVLASASDDGKLILWDTSEGWAAKSFSPHEGTRESKGRKTFLLKSPGVLSVDFAPDGNLVTSGRDRSIRLFKAAAQPLATQKDLPALPTAAVFLHDGKSIVSSDFLGTLSIWSHDEKQRRFNAPVHLRATTKP